METNKPIVVITTKLEPESCGTGTCSWLWSERWRAQDSTRTHFLTTLGAKASREYLNYSHIEEFGPGFSALARLLEESGADQALLHYTGHGYHRRGFPWRLPIILKQWKNAKAGRRLTVMFHEIWADLPLASVHGIAQRINRNTVKKLGCLADQVLTNSAEHAERLKNLCGDITVDIVPVGTQVFPVSPVDPSFSRRDPSLFLLFGLNFGRLQALKTFASKISELHAKGILKQLELVGPIDARWGGEEEKFLKDLLPAEAVIRRGELREPEVSQRLQSAGFFLLDQHPSGFTKSGRLMALAAHACAVVAMARAEDRPACFFTTADELLQKNGPEFLPEMEKRAAGLHAWYEELAGRDIVLDRLDKLFL